MICLLAFPKVSLFILVFFPSEALITAARGILYGPSSLSGRGGSGGPKPKAQLWGLKSVTPGFIAAIIVFVLHRLTPDGEWHSPGKVTHVNWEARFDTYLLILHRNFEWTDKLIAYWNERLFPSASGSTKKRSAPKDPLAHAKSLFDKIQARSVSSDAGDADAQPAPQAQPSDALQIETQIGQMTISGTNIAIAPASSVTRVASARAAASSSTPQPLSSASAVPHETPREPVAAPMAVADPLATKPARKTRAKAKEPQAQQQAPEETQPAEPKRAKRTKRT
ncbi:hypothetical protein CONPUDRAFT_159050 [Coniophora puteana RWD-64-598 SS2]|uniref:Uncharacterized protein n=1 Tax=Coniophora puteana (strain RWD-64-598) TaxID=741705 RepID=A0A5M3M8S2_CONPW|nr:uncharacterized protein CONPUDRAFT_159050 [Coniophora puteana RWD-64-598 SS2]EIW75599.1 hypothetical protein CONPUDRAFT_159050 [Coniophora puteana RWD-64-598 SS2]